MFLGPDINKPPSYVDPDGLAYIQRFFSESQSNEPVDELPNDPESITSIPPYRTEGASVFNTIVLSPTMTTEDVTLVNDAVPNTLKFPLIIALPLTYNPEEDIAVVVILPCSVTCCNVGIYEALVAILAYEALNACEAYDAVPNSDPVNEGAVIVPVVFIEAEEKVATSLPLTNNEITLALIWFNPSGVFPIYIFMIFLKQIQLHQLML